MILNIKRGTGFARPLLRLAKLRSMCYDGTDNRGACAKQAESGLRRPDPQT